MQATALRQQVFKPATSRGHQRRPAPCVSCAAAPEQQQRQAPILKQLAVGLAAAALLHSAPADAGVIIQKTQTKKLFQSEPVEQVKKSAGNAADKASGAAPSLPKVNLPSGGGPNLSQLTLPLAIGGIAVGTLGWRKLDPGFNAFFDDALAKNSNKIGAGYEQVIKSGSGMKGGAKKAAKKVSGGFFSKKK